MSEKDHIRFISLCAGGYWKGFAALVESIAENSGLERAEYSFTVYTTRRIPSNIEKWIATREEPIEVLESKRLEDIEALVPQEQPNLTDALKKLVLLGEGCPESRYKHVLIDADMICLSSLRPIFKMPDFAAAPNNLLCPEVSEADPSGVIEVNTGFMCFEPCEQIRDELVSLYKEAPDAYCKAADQDVINAWNRREQRIHLLGTDWNLLKTALCRKSCEEQQTLFSNARILHFIQDKPWQIDHCAKWHNLKYMIRAERIWWQFYQKSGLRSPDLPLLANHAVPFRRLGSSLWQFLRRRASTKASRLRKRFQKCA